MKTLKTIGVVATSVCLSLVAQAAQAADFTKVGSDWHIVLDSFKDGTDGSLNGVGSPSKYEMFGMAIKADQDTVSIAINANIPLLGNYAGGAADDNVGYGDLFFNFSGKAFKDASAANQLFGIRFAGSNDSGVGSVGVYGDVQAKSVVSSNSGWSSFNSYQNWVEGNNRDKTPGATGTKSGEVGFGDLSAGEARHYLTAETTMKQVRKTIRVPETRTRTVRRNGQRVTEEYTVMVNKRVWETVPETKIQDKNYSIQNVIASGNLLGGITMLSNDELAGLDFGTSNSSVYSLAHTFGFSFDRNLLPDGEALISLLAECVNDGMVMAMNFEPNQTTPESVPEPATVTSLALVGLALAGSKFKRQNKA
ncbi:PEP-CTERM sorting domain-containing protein [Capilliphycus salinus ALCB114379]|uniref:PEP-CTERM sorting domain-containing protein n=1 Tax=Capilliphycus salinus TaxID=2768948 RepID=UPI0039A47484